MVVVAFGDHDGVLRKGGHKADWEVGEAWRGVAREPLASEPREDWDHVSKGGGQVGWGYRLEERGREQPGKQPPLQQHPTNLVMLGGG